MKVIQCESMETIVSEQENKKSEKIIFRELREIELVALHKLESFCSSNSCDFEFPSLEKVVASACGKMEMFTSSKKPEVNETLKQICVSHGEEKKRLYWEGDLNATISHVFKFRKYFEGMGEMSFSNHPELWQAWQGVVDPQSIHNWFHSLKILKLEKCDIQPYAIPSNILPYLTSLRELEVRNCKYVKVIFEMNVREGAGAVFQLQKLTLQGLKMLMHVWKRNGEGTHNFENLQLVFVSGCVKLLNVFPAALAKNLKKLEKLEIEKCDELQEIVEKEEKTGIQNFEFPCLTTLQLQCLPRLIYFYPAPFILQSPELSNLFVFGCPELELFKSANRNPLFSDLKDFFNLEELTLKWAHSSGLKSALEGHTGNLDYLNNIRLFFDVGVNERPVLPIEILLKAPNLKEMSIESCHCLDVFAAQIPEIEEKRMLKSLKTLTLNGVWKLGSIGSEDSPWLSVIGDTLHKFQVIDCPDLKTLVHSTSAAVSFFCLKELFISDCGGLVCLFTSSTVNKLTHLERIDVSNCESLQEIVAQEEDNPTWGQIKLERLYCIVLKRLPKLECFYAGNYTLQLPSLKQVDIWKCRKMEIFSQGRINVESSFKGLQASNDSNDELVLYDDDVNSSVKKVFLLQVEEDLGLMRGRGKARPDARPKRPRKGSAWCEAEEGLGFVAVDIGSAQGEAEYGSACREPCPVYKPPKRGIRRMLSIYVVEG
ncbi:hypothetical protein Fmac_011812 [Flemingia macrophylla]|uniref:Disease resistance protein At4g27190-like leucine-rich repeats domain-containing protein n=1 Tax=Flemingia macrophylla TaxID=520843 RepID=A0ABD1MNV7_9FABA